jgi:3-deoxy-D-manno-octulosonic-acid transferase
VYLLYSVLLAVAFALSAPFYLWKGRGTGKYLRTLGDRMGRLPPELALATGPSIWIHAVSVGEVLAARVLVQPLKARFPGHRVYVSTTTLTGNAVARDSVRGADGVFFAPFDFARPVARVLDRLNPVLLVLVETEIWPNLIHGARQRGARVAVVNGRISPRSFPRYRRMRAVLRHVLAEVDLFLMQGDAHRERMLAMGAPAERVRVVGNLKYDALREPETPAALRRALGQEDPDAGPLWVAGSTVAGEEEAVLAAFAALRRVHARARVVIAPRHPERFAAVADLVMRAGLACARRTQLPEGGWQRGDVVVLDTLGELAQVYPLATLVFVGGSLERAGGHNVLEPAVAGKAIIVGPHMENFREIAAEFLAEGALVQVRDAAGLTDAVLRLCADAAARDALGSRARGIVARNRGALARTVDALAGLLVPGQGETPGLVPGQGEARGIA